MPRTRTPLSLREHDFIRHYLAGERGVRGNATRAYIAAGYAARAAAAGASQLLRKPRVRKAIADYLARADLSAQRVLAEIRRIAFSSMGDFADWGPDGVTLRASQELTEDQAACVAEVADHTRTRVVASEGGRPRVQVEDRQIRIKLHDKIEALRLAAKALGLLKDKVEVEVSGIFPPGFFEAVVSGDLSKLPPKYREAAQRALPPGPITDAELVGPATAPDGPATP